MAGYDTPQKRVALSNRLNDISREIAKETGIPHITIVAFHAEGNDRHIMEGGTGTPVDWVQIFKRLITGREMGKSDGQPDHVLSRRQ